MLKGVKFSEKNINRAERRLLSLSKPTSFGEMQNSEFKKMSRTLAEPVEATAYGKSRAAACCGSLVYYIG
jgi:hypothetical protein